MVELTVPDRFALGAAKGISQYFNKARAMSFDGTLNATVDNPAVTSSDIWPFSMS